MRINLVTPFAEKDAVKALGARWDASKKVWYITDVADLTPFSRWIPSLDAATEDAALGARQPTTTTQKTSTNESRGVITQSAIAVPHCGCTALPWEDCEHTATK